MEKLIEGFEERYTVNTNGEVFSLSYRNSRKKKRMCEQLNMYGYSIVQLTNKNGRRPYKVHRLVAKTFIPNPKNKPTVNHINGNKEDNRVENLEWATIAENQKHAYRTGIKNTSGENNGNSKYTKHQIRKLKTMHKEGYSYSEISRACNISKKYVQQIIREKRWPHIKV